MTFNFTYQKCSICGTLSDDGAWVLKKRGQPKIWICLKCLDNIYDDSCNDTTERGDENETNVLQTGGNSEQS